jgi:hypothetical protein
VAIFSFSASLTTPVAVNDTVTALDAAGGGVGEAEGGGGVGEAEGGGGVGEAEGGGGVGGGGVGDSTGSGE